MGWELERALAPLGEVISTDLGTLDLADSDAIRRVLRKSEPGLIVNAAAYTAVDRAESEPEQAMQINGVAPGVLAEEAERLGALLVHYSTDYVFDGRKVLPYVEGDAANPLNVYGKTKLAGERAIESSGSRYLILRSSWIYGPRGSNFLLTILRLARERSELRVVDDQVGAPTFCRALAEITAAIVPRALCDSSVHGRYHATSAGETSWFGFAREILRLANVATPVYPIPSSEYPTPAARPANSRLDNGKLHTTFGAALPDWQVSLAECMRSLSSLD